MTKVTEEQMHPLDGMIDEVLNLATSLHREWNIKTDDTNRRNPPMSLILDYLTDIHDMAHSAKMEGRYLDEVEGVE